MNDTQTAEFTPRVVEQVPPVTRGTRRRTHYDDVFDLVLKNSPHTVLAAENVAPHKATTMRSAMAARLGRPENVNVALTGEIIVEARKTSAAIPGEPSSQGRPPVDLYVSYVPRAEQSAEQSAE